MRIHQHTEVTDVTVVDNQVRGVTTPHGDIAAPIVVNCTAAWSTLVSDMAGVRLPISAFPLQAAVTEPVRPFLPTVVVSGTLHVDIDQTDRGELVFGASVDRSPRTRPAAASPSPRASGTYSSSCRRPSQLRLLRQGAGLRDIDVRLLADHGRDAGRAGPGRRRLGRGFTAGPVAGEAMARLIATGKTPELIAASMSPASPTAGQSASGRWAIDRARLSHVRPRNVAEFRYVGERHVRQKAASAASCRCRRAPARTAPVSRHAPAGPLPRRPRRS